MDRFWVTGRSPSRRDRLQRAVRSGSSTSRYSFSKNVGSGSSSHDFGAAARMMRRNSSRSTAFTSDRLDVIGGNAGGGEPAVASQMFCTLAENDARKSSAVKDGASGERQLAHDQG